MPRKRSTVKKRQIPDVEDWQVKYLLTGTEPGPDVDPWLCLDFLYGKPDHFDNWRSVWDRVKDNPLIRKWKKENGKTYAEKRLSRS